MGYNDKLLDINKQVFFNKIVVIFVRDVTSSAHSMKIEPVAPPL